MVVFRLKTLMLYQSCIINVSSINISTHLNILDIFKYGCYNWYQSRSIQIVPWVINDTIQVVVLFELRILVLIVIFG
jgi:hypothetical protein